MSGRVIILGLDGGEPSLIFKIAQEGQLPNIKKLMDNGVHGKLNSTIPPITAPAWTASQTGKQPGKHGIFHFFVRNPETYERVIRTANDIQGDTIWTILSRNDKKVATVNVPVTFPPRPVNGTVVSGMPIPGDWMEFTYPKDFKKKIMKEFNYRIETHKDNYYKKEAFVKDVNEVTESHMKVVNYLLDDPELDCLMYVFQGLDQLQHFFWDDQETIIDFLKVIDNYIGEIVEKNPDATYVMCSDHGFGTQKGEFYIGNWFVQEGLLNFKKTSQLNAMRKIGFTRENIYKIIFKSKILHRLALMMPKFLKKKVPTTLNSLEDIDWDTTKVYSVAPGQIYINLKGREGRGIVEPEDYEAVKKQVIDGLKKLNSGINVYDGKKVYSGEFVDEGPDIIVDSLPEGYLEGIFGPKGVIFGPHKKSGTHRQNGIFVCSGPEINSGKVVDAEIIDITPTILHLFGIPIPKDMDGIVRKDIFLDNSSASKRKVTFKNAEEKEELKILQAVDGLNI